MLFLEYVKRYFRFSPVSSRWQRWHWWSCGLSALNVHPAVSDSFVDFGAALCEAASEWSIEPVYYEAA
jgi:hypothetical protein